MASRFLRLTFLLVASWAVMTFTHETGHIAGGWLSGGKLQTADLLPWHLPYSIFDPDPRPLITLWSGPILGVVVPVSLAMMLRRPWIWFIANFCVLANGTYIAASWFSGDRYLDTPKLIEHGASPTSIGLYCVLTIGLGYAGFRRSCIHILSPSSRQDVEQTSTPILEATPKADSQ